MTKNLNFNKLICVCLVLVPVIAWAEIVVYGLDDDQEVSVEKANLLAVNEANRRGTCVSAYSNPAECAQQPNGKYSCLARVSKYKSSCGGGVTLADDFRGIVGSLNDLCSNGRQTACAAAAGAAF